MTLTTCLPAVPEALKGNPPLLGEYEGYDVYPMPIYVGLQSENPIELAETLIKGLGFGVMFLGPDLGLGPTLIHLRRRNFQDVLITQGKPTATRCYLNATDELDDLFSKAYAFNANMAHEPVPLPWGGRECVVMVTEGVELVFFETPEQPKETIDDVFESMKKEQEGQEEREG